MRFLIGFILLAFPIAEIWLLIELGQRYGGWVLLYLVLISFLGLRLIRGEKLLMATKMMQNLREGGHPIKTMLGSARNVLAGVLLIIPGIITDIIAVILLLIPIDQTKRNVPSQTQYHTQYKKAANDDDVIEGEFHRED
jgi:UPF0716 protein FxsA